MTVFIGMCRGVGKTCAMLSSGEQRSREGIDVVVGLVEPRGRAETLRRLGGLPRLSAESPAGHLDLAGLLRRSPQIVLVDDLAEINPPGTRNGRRYQDVLELLSADIDVYATLDVRELESRAEAVRQITGTPVGVTIPDAIVDGAEDVVLVDVTPARLIERWLDEEEAGTGLGEEQLTALREIALRFVAERMDRRLRELRVASGSRDVWRSNERLLVAVGPSPSSAKLVRWTRRMAAAQGADWVAVAVESPRSLSTAARRNMEANLVLARELGAEIVVTQDHDVADALVRTALAQNATQIFVGRSNAPRLLDRLNGGSTVDRLIRRGGPFDIHVLGSDRPDEGETKSTAVGGVGTRPSPLKEYLLVLQVIAAVTLVGELVGGTLGYHAVGMFYLIAIVALSLLVGRGPMLVAGLGGALAWDFVFIPPVLSLHMDSTEDTATLAAFFVAAVVTGELTARIRDRERNEHAREERATALLQLTQSLSAAGTLDDALRAALDLSDRLFEARSALLLVGEEDRTLERHPTSSLEMGTEENDIADWVLRNGRRAGRFTGTFAENAGYFVPLARGHSTIGVFVVAVAAEASLTLAQRDLAESIASQMAMVVERDRLRKAGEREKLLAASERLQRSLFDGVSHELKTPIAVLTTSTERLATADSGTRDLLLGEIRTAIGRLGRLVNNLLDQTRLESGAVRPRMDWCDAEDLVYAARDAACEALAGHPLTVTVHPSTPLFRADFALMEQVLANLLTNAGLHTPDGTPVHLEAGPDADGVRVCFSVADEGPGLPAGLRERLFQKFERGEAARPGGLGLGLSIVRGFVLAQGGEIVVGDRPGGGAVFSVYLSCAKHGIVPS